jgi:hypothetical protein
VASILIGVILTVTAAFLARETQSLLTGEGMAVESQARVRGWPCANPACWG